MPIFICGHRGARREAPENTLESFRRCIDMGADMIELDVRRTMDGVLVIHHDAAAGDMLLSRYDLSTLKARYPAIPTLEDACRLCRGRIRLDIEIKEAGFEKQVIDLVSSFMKREEYLFSSFDDRVITRIKDISPDLSTGLLLGHSHPRSFGRSHRESLRYHKRLDDTGADWVLFHSWQLYFGVLETVPEGIKAGVWTENRERWIKKLIRDDRVHMICTDRPRRALGLRDEG